MGRKTKTFTIKLSKKLCRSAKEPACGLVSDSDTKFPKITDVIEEYKEGIVDDMFETRLKISSLSNSLHDVYNMDAEAHFISIPALEDAEADENISRMLARKNNVEYLFHKEYAELVVLVRYLESSARPDHRRIRETRHPGRQGDTNH
ncbi:uncharacterized protein LOC127857898 isoform X2 [Dreissena polymorpha]|nr:uncharacterized protein LOC127857898 isoform X2 [Dreissena polymorpha]